MVVYVAVVGDAGGEGGVVVAVAAGVALDPSVTMITEDSAAQAEGMTVVAAACAAQQRTAEPEPLAVAHAVEVVGVAVVAAAAAEPPPPPLPALEAMVGVALVVTACGVGVEVALVLPTQHSPPLQPRPPPTAGVRTEREVKARACEKQSLPFGTWRGVPLLLRLQIHEQTVVA